MVERVEVFDVTIPAGTLISAPQTTALSYVDGTLTGVEIIFPDGCLGLVGARFDYGGVQLIPKTDGLWIRGNDEKVDWQTHGYPAGAGWQLTGYNTGLFPHTLQVRMLISELRFGAESRDEITPIPLIGEMVGVE